ncbi:MAG: carboxypeptidase regulatory-like domain-containing protein [Polyangiaceae bacterium]
MNRTHGVRSALWITFAAVAATFAVVAACARSVDPEASDFGDASVDVGSDAGTDGPPALGTVSDGSLNECVNLQCRQKVCPGGGKTTVSGFVWDPARLNPLYNVVVYVPNAPLGPLARGVTPGAPCSCDALYSGQPIATALTDAKGHFVLENVPVGSDVPLVVQIGKWRRQFTIGPVEACKDNPQPYDRFTLPKNKDEGDIPNIAVSTGSADSLECLLRRIGLDPKEFVAGEGTPEGGHVHVFRGDEHDGGILAEEIPDTVPSAPKSRDALWTSSASLMKYDIVLLSCEGRPTEDTKPAFLAEYTSAGGRVFAEHYHHAWLRSGAPFDTANVATWSDSDGGDAYRDPIEATIVTTLPDGNPFPRGVAMNEWMKSVNGLLGGKLRIKEARHNALVGAANPVSQSWIVADDAAAPPSTQYFSFDMPLDAGLDERGLSKVCGRVVFSDLHVGADARDYESSVGKVVPSGCSSRDLSGTEKALEFMLFDLSSCVEPVSSAPKPPPIR